MRTNFWVRIASATVALERLCSSPPLSALIFLGAALLSALPAFADDLAKSASVHGAASESEPYGKLVPLRIIPKASVVEPSNISSGDLAPNVQIDPAAGPFTQAAWMVPRSFEKPKVETAQPLDGPSKKDEGIQPAVRSGRSPPLLKSTAVAPTHPRKTVSKPHITKVKTTDGLRSAPSRLNGSQLVPMPSVLAPTIQP